MNPVLTKKNGSGAQTQDRIISIVFFFVFILMVSDVPLLSLIQKTSLDPDPGLKGLQRTSHTKSMKSKKNTFEINIIFSFYFQFKILPSYEVQSPGSDFWPKTGSTSLRSVFFKQFPLLSSSSHKRD